MPIPSLNGAYDKLEEFAQGRTGNVNIGIEYHTAILNAAAVHESAAAIRDATQALSNHVGALERAVSNAANEADKQANETHTLNRRIFALTVVATALATLQALAALAQVWDWWTRVPPSA